MDKLAEAGKVIKTRIQQIAKQTLVEFFSADMTEKEIDELSKCYGHIIEEDLINQDKLNDIYPEERDDSGDAEELELNKNI